MTAASRASYAPRASRRPRAAGARRRASGTGRGRDLGRTGFALYLTGGTLAALIFLLPLAWAVLRSFMPRPWSPRPRRPGTSRT